MQFLNRDLRLCQVKSEVTLRVKGRDIKPREWRGFFGDWLPRPEGFGGYLRNGQGNERQLVFADPRDAITYAVAVRRHAERARKPYGGLEICVVVDVGDVIRVRTPQIDSTRASVEAPSS